MILSSSIDTYDKLSRKAINMLKTLSAIHKRNSRKNFLHLGGICHPMGARKLFVNVDGKLHICERVDSCCEIGSVETWIEIERVNSILDRYIKFKFDKCHVCWAKQLCTLCYSAFAQNNEFVLHKELCESERDMIENALQLYVRILETRGENALSAMIGWLDEHSE